MRPRLVEVIQFKEADAFLFVEHNDFSRQSLPNGCH